MDKEPSNSVSTKVIKEFYNPVNEEWISRYFSYDALKLISLYIILNGKTGNINYTNLPFKFFKDSLEYLHVIS